MHRIHPALLVLALAAAPVASRAQTVSAPAAASKPGWVREGQTDIRLPDTTRMNRTARAILALERRRSALIARQDTLALSAIYSADFRGVTAPGTPVDRARLFGVFALDDPAARFEIDELAVRPVGSAGNEPVVVVTGQLKMFRGAEEVSASRYIHVWERRARGWTIVAAQGTAVGAPGR